jgi:hypothetical protein
VNADQAQVQVTLRLTNESDRTARWSRGRVGLRVGAKSAVAAMSSTLPPSSLTAGTSIEGALGSVAARNGATLQLELPTKDGPVLVDLGRTDVDTGTNEEHGGHQ